ncbi:MarR family winged helix-turn-helix transcriptional regulator [Bradyrhizobium prioriisuperbiae]|uniref:MarR family winged helix-turn-helix transcriptional regulator n=1 Tax=Bradyrhizobium prioriisuperbiae TaxID=2854389 RepID=UPI0038991BCC
MPNRSALLDSIACNCSALRKAARRVSLLYDRCLAPSGLTIGQYAILAEIALCPKDESPTLTSLAQALVMDRTALSHTLKPLERDGLVRIGRDPRDRRAKLVHLTARGREQAAVARSCWGEAQARFSTAFGDDQAIALRALLRLVTDADLGEPRL